MGFGSRMDDIYIGILKNRIDIYLLDKKGIASRTLIRVGAKGASSLDIYLLDKNS
jgi:hypothetical protein